jgi:hypothetical protein
MVSQTEKEFVYKKLNILLMHCQEYRNELSDVSPSAITIISTTVSVISNYIKKNSIRE